MARQALLATEYEYHKCPKNKTYNKQSSKKLKKAKNFKKSTSLKKSPVHLAIISVIIKGKPNEMLPVASINITVKHNVIRTTPPNWAAAPIKAYFPGSVQVYNKKIKLVEDKKHWNRVIENLHNQGKSFRFPFPQACPKQHLSITKV